MDSQRRYDRKSNYVSRTIADTLLLVPVREPNSILTLNEVASFILEHMDGTRTVMDLSTLLCNTYDVDPQTALDDVVQLAEELEQTGVVALNLAATS